MSNGRLLAALILWVAAFSLWVINGWGGDRLRLPIGDLAFLPVSIAGVALSIRAARSDARLRLPWLLIASAFGATLAGDGVWAFLELVRHTEPFPSPADPFYLAFYPLMLAGLITMPVAARRRGDGLKFALDSTTVLIGAGMIVWYFVMRPLVAAAHPGALAATLSLAYPAGDLVLIFGAATVLFRRPSPSARKAVALLAAGVALFVIADIAYGMLALRNSYATGDWPDALWMAAQCLFVFAAHAQYAGRNLDAVEAPDRGSDRPVTILPYMSILVGYGLLFIVARPVATTTIGGLLMGAIALTVLVVARQVTVIFENARLLDRLKEMARTDDLTGLFTRRAFMDLADREWARAQRYHHPLCALAIDIDRFKQVNDTLGHRTGDDVLAAVARRIRLSLRITDVLGRTGGDEFVAVLPDTTTGDAAALVERLRGLMSLPLESAEGPVAVTVSVGVATADGCATMSEFLHRADTALYVAKQDGRDCVRMLIAG